MTAVAETNEPGGDVTARSARPRHLIITVYGLYARSDGGWLSVAALIRLLADLGVDEPAVRSAISRLKRRGILEARRHEGSAGYQLSAEALAILHEGDARIFRQHRARLADGWLLAVFSVPETQRQHRHVLRSELTRLGFGMVAPGVWIVPAHPQDATAETLRRLGLDSYADLFHADHLVFGHPAGKIRRWWDLEELERRYEEFIRAHEPALHRWQQRRGKQDRREQDRGEQHRGEQDRGERERGERERGERERGERDRGERERGERERGERDRGERDRGEQHRGERDRGDQDLAGAGSAREHEAFADYVRALTDWRRLPYSDPGLPAELLSPGWIGIRATEAFFALRSLLEEPARAYVQRVISG